MMLAVEASTVGIIGSLLTTVVFSGAALYRSTKGDKALNATTMLTATWTQTTDLINQLQEENSKLRAGIADCDRKCAEVKAAADLVIAQLTALQQKHWELQMEIELLRRHTNGGTTSG